MAKTLIPVFGALLLLAKGKGVVALEQGVLGGKELLSGNLEGLQGFEGRQFSSLVGTAPWLQGAGQLLRIFGEARCWFKTTNYPIVILINLCSYFLSSIFIIGNWCHHCHDFQAGKTAQRSRNNFDNCFSTSWLRAKPAWESGPWYGQNNDHHRNDDIVMTF